LYIIIRTHYQTRIFINFESSTFNVCKHLTDLKYASDFYKIEIKPTILSLEQFIFFGYVKLNNCIKITTRLMTNEFHPLKILTILKTNTLT